MVAFVLIVFVLVCLALVDRQYRRNPVMQPTAPTKPWTDPGGRKGHRINPPDGHRIVSRPAAQHTGGSDGAGERQPSTPGSVRQGEHLPIFRSQQYSVRGALPARLQERGDGAAKVVATHQPARFIQHDGQPGPGNRHQTIAAVGSQELSGLTQES